MRPGSPPTPAPWTRSWKRPSSSPAAATRPLQLLFESTTLNPSTAPAASHRATRFVKSPPPPAAQADQPAAGRQLMRTGGAVAVQPVAPAVGTTVRHATPLAFASHTASIATTDLVDQPRPADVRRDRRHARQRAVRASLSSAW